MSPVSVIGTAVFPSPVSVPVVGACDGVCVEPLGVVPSTVVGSSVTVVVTGRCVVCELCRSNLVLVLTG